LLKSETEGTGPYLGNNLIVIEEVGDETATQLMLKGTWIDGERTGCFSL
jgi:hypothetical protein